MYLVDILSPYQQINYCSSIIIITFTVLWCHLQLIVLLADNGVSSQGSLCARLFLSLPVIVTRIITVYYSLLTCNSAILLLTLMLQSIE